MRVGEGVVSGDSTCSPETQLEMSSRCRVPLAVDLWLRDKQNNLLTH